MLYQVNDTPSTKRWRAVQEFMGAYRELGHWKRWFDRQRWDGPSTIALFEAMTADVRAASARAEQAWRELREAFARNPGEDPKPE